MRRAQAHFQRGVELYEEEHYDGALAEFTRAHELVPNYRVLYNMAQTQVERHDYVDAVRLFEEYLAQGGAEIPPARRQATEREREELLERVATVTLESNVSDAELQVDGQLRGVVPSSHQLRLNSGVVELRLSKAGYAPASRQLTLAGKDAVVVEMNLERAAPLVAAAPAAPAPVAERDAGSNAGLWLSAGATTLLAGATATFAVLALRENSELDRELDQYQPAPSRLEDTRSRVRTYAALTDGFGAATVLGLGAVVYFLIDGAGAERAPEAASARSLQLRIAGSGVSLRKDF